MLPSSDCYVTSTPKPSTGPNSEGLPAAYPIFGIVHRVIPRIRARSPANPHGYGIYPLKPGITR